VELTPAAAAAVRRIAEIKATLHDLEQEAETAEAMVKAELRDADTATVDGVVAVTWKQAKPSHYFEAKAFRAAMPDIAEQFTTERPGNRRFLIKQ
jgi:predicted phage-related endonuclease